MAEAVAPSDLPAPERRAVHLHLAGRAGLDPGAYDDDAHAAFGAAPSGMRAAAERKAAIARFMVAASARAQGGELDAVVRSKFGSKGTSKASLRRIREAVASVAPVNFGPALLSDHKGCTVRATASEDAWRMFLSIVERAAPTFPLTAAWRDVRDLAPAQGWDWPSYPTVFRRWQALPATNRHMLREGRAAMVKAKAIPVMRDKTTVAPLDLVSLDGRTQDFWVDFGDGRVARPVMLALVDVASNVVLGHVLAPSENAGDTVQLITRTCQANGIFRRLYTDNGSAFAGHLVAGGQGHRFRTHGRAPGAVSPPGVCAHLGIETVFAIPGNPGAKIAERVFATLSRSVDDRPEFRGAHAGHAPGASPAADVVPVPLAVAQGVIDREIARHNHEPGRRSQGARGRSYQAVFDAGIAAQVVTRPGAEQLRRAGMAYKFVAVDRWGRVKAHTWTYGGPETQDALLAHHGGGRRVLLGYHPDDFAQPATVFDLDGRVICGEVAAVVAKAYADAAGARLAARHRKAIRTTAAAHVAANRTHEEAELDAALAALPTPGGDRPAAPAKVVGARFGGPVELTPEDRAPRRARVSEQSIARLDAFIERKRAGTEGREGR